MCPLAFFNGLNKRRGSKFDVGSRVQQGTSEDQSTHRPKCGEYKNKDEDNSPKILNDKKYYGLVRNFPKGFLNLAKFLSFL